MDYEKAYKESFGVAKCLHEAGDVITKKQMERLFPQLVESDDEWNWRKVRRAIRGFFTNPIDANELLAWLEKQKECVINSNKTSTGEDERIRKALIDALKMSETIGELKFRLPYPTREECIAYLEKQKEPENTSVSTMVPSCWEVEQK